MLLDHGLWLSSVIRSGGAQKVPYINFSIFFNNFKDPTYEQAIDAVDAVFRKFFQPIESGNLSHSQANSLGKQVIRSLLRVRSENMILGDPEEHEEALGEPNVKG